MKAGNGKQSETFMATVDEIAEVRRAIGDTAKQTVQQFEGDGYTLLFALQYKNVQEVGVTVGNQNVTPDLVYSGAGQVQLNDAPEQGDKVIISYEYAGFTDLVLESLIDRNGVQGAIIEALKDLLASASRRTDYVQGQTNVKASQVFQHLKDLLGMYSPGGQFSAEGGLSMGTRVPQPVDNTIVREDLSRSDNFSDNNV